MMNLDTLTIFPFLSSTTDEEKYILYVDLGLSAPLRSSSMGNIYDATFPTILADNHLLAQWILMVPITVGAKGS